MPGFPPAAHRKGGEMSRKVNADMANEFYAPIIPVVVELRCQGLSLRAIARELDRRGIRTRQVGWVRYSRATSEGPRRGKIEFIRWSATQVRRVLARAAATCPYESEASR